MSVTSHFHIQCTFVSHGSVSTNWHTLMAISSDLRSSTAESGRFIAAGFLWTNLKMQSWPGSAVDGIDVEVEAPVPCDSPMSGKPETTTQLSESESSSSGWNSNKELPLCKRLSEDEADEEAAPAATAPIASGAQVDSVTGVSPLVKAYVLMPKWMRKPKLLRLSDSSSLSFVNDKVKVKLKIK